MLEQWTTESEDTMILLQEEIERLENELRLRDEALAGSHHPSDAPPAAFGESLELHQRIEELRGELTGRDESIALLLEQIRLFEEAETASRAEWEQLSSWVTEVERRVERRDTVNQDVQLELETERNQATAQRLAFEKDRRGWEAQREALEDELERLRVKLAELANHTEAAPDAAYAALESENRRLRETCHTLVRASAEAADANGLRTQLQLALNQVEELRREVEQLNDDRQRERLEAEAAQAAMRNQMVVAALKPAVEEPVVKTPPVVLAQPEVRPESLSVDDRIRALRQHLVEIHERERAERTKNSLGSRLSRLWRNTGP